jgi:hypothetical protein
LLTVDQRWEGNLVEAPTLWWQNGKYYLFYSANIQDHTKAFGYPGRALRDPQHLAVTLTQARVTPEAAVFDASGKMVYRGRIDDRYVDLGLERPAATKRDLEDALNAVLSGRSVEQPVTQAVGCFLVDLQS